MSLAKDKASLFSTDVDTTSGGKSNKASKAPASSTSASSQPARAPAVVKTRGGAIATLSAEAKARKLAEAKENSSKGAKCLQTSIFQWSPDYVLAAPYFERAGECYKILAEFGLSRQMFLQAADAHEKLGANSAAALTILKAANISQMEDDFSGAAALFHKAAEQWMLQGDGDKAASAIDKAAAELENVDEDKAIESYERACSLVFPEETPETQFSNIRTNAVDIFRHYIVFNLSHQRYSKLLPLLDRLGKLYQAFDMQSAMCKCMMATTLVQLHMGDIVEADKVFLQSHLNNSEYLKSNECAVAENFLNSFKNYDVEALDKARGPTSIMYVDSDFQAFARSLSFLRSGGAPSGHIKVSADDFEAVSKNVLPAVVANMDINEDSTDNQDVDLKGVGDSELENKSNDPAPAPTSLQQDDDDEIDLC